MTINLKQRAARFTLSSLALIFILWLINNCLLFGVLTAFLLKSFYLEAFHIIIFKINYIMIRLEQFLVFCLLINFGLNVDTKKLL